MAPPGIGGMLPGKRSTPERILKNGSELLSSPRTTRMNWQKEYEPEYKETLKALGILPTCTSPYANDGNPIYLRQKL